MKLIKKIPKLCLMFMTALTTILGAYAPVKAAVVNWDNPIPTNYYYGDAGDIDKLQVNGKDSFCVEWDKAVTTINGYSVSSYSTVFSTAQWEELVKIAHVGYNTEKNSLADFAATQVYIWQTTRKYDGYDMWFGGNTNIPNFQDRIQAIRDGLNLINDIETKNVSFKDSVKNIKVGETISLTDSNGLLSRGKFIVKSSSTGITASISGNTLKITASASAPENSSVVVSIPSVNRISENTLFTHPTSQNVSHLGFRDPLTAKITLKVEKYGSLKITKQDEDGTKVPNTSFKLSKNADMSSPLGTYKTGADGTVTINELLPTDYYVQESAVPAHLTLDSTIHKVTVEPNQTATYTANNNWKKGYIQVTKTDADTGKTVTAAQTTFDVYKVSDNSLVTTITTDNTGKAKTGLLRYADYYLKEKNAPAKYTLNANKTDNISVHENGATYTATISNKRVTANLSISKEDSVTGKQPQGEATLQGAVYGLYARNAILDPADNSILYAANAKVKELTTNAEGNASVSDLYLGDYYVKEITPSHGYTLDTTEYDVALAYKDQNTPVITKSQTVKERVISQAFSIIKVSDNYVGEADLLKGIEFTIKAQKDIDAAGSWEAAPIAKNAQGQTAALLVTDEKGYAVSDRLPFGSYVVRETKGTNEHYLIPDFTVTVDKDSSEPQAWRVFDDVKWRAVIRIEKHDEETGNIVKLAGAEFKIKNLRTGKYVEQFVTSPKPHYVNTWTTTEEGIIYTDKMIDPGEYQLEETKAPAGYAINTEPVKFEVKNNVAYEMMEDGETPLITVTQKDTSVKGKILVSKEGEVLVSADKTDNGVNFHYETRKLADAVFEVYAAEDIYTADNSGTLIYRKGELVDTVTTNSNGTATSRELPLGKYQVKEKTAPNGFIHSEEVKDIELRYLNQTTPLVFSDAGVFQNDRQKVQVDTMKLDADTQKGVEGAEISLYANRDIYNIDGEVIVEAGTYLGKATTGKDGKSTFDIDLPNDLTPADGVMPIDDELDEEFTQTVIDDIKLIGNTNDLFYVTESKAPAGYATGQKVQQYFGTTYTNQDEATLKFAFEFQNEPTKLLISKTDITGEKELPGAHLQIIDKATGKIVKEWVSTDKPRLIERLPIGDYELVEQIAPDGFAIAQPVQFTVMDTANIQKVQMKDEVTEMEFSKVDETGTDELEGAKLQVIDKETGKLIDEWISGKETHKITGLVTGKEYLMKEVSAPYGYEIAEEITFIAQDGKKVIMKDNLILTDIQVNKVSSVTNKPIKNSDFAFTVYSDAACTQPIKTVHANRDDGTATFKDMPYGTYYIKETAAPVGYLLSKEVKKVVLDEKTKGIGDVYSFIYADSPIPSSKTVKTGDTTQTSALIGLFGLSGLALLYIKSKKRGKNVPATGTREYEKK